MLITDHGRVAIAELIAYVPALACATAVCLRHGFKKTQGWIFIIIVCVLRIGGSVCQLIADNHPSEAVIKTTLVFDSIGVAPLLLTALGILSRMADWANAATGKPLPHFHPRLFSIIQITIAAGLILGVIGVTSMSATSTNSPPTTSRVGVLVFIVDLIALIVIFGLSLSGVSAVPDREKALVVCIPLVLATFAVRIAYGVLCIFIHSATFNLFNGSMVAKVAMSVAEEMFIVVTVIALGFRLQQIRPEDQGEITGRGQKKEDSSGRKGLFRRRHGGTKAQTEYVPMNVGYKNQMEVA